MARSQLRCGLCTSVQEWLNQVLISPIRPGYSTPALSAFAVHVGNVGELVDRLFLDDFSQYAPPFVDSIAIPKRLMEQLEEAKALEFTIDIPPGIGAVRIFSAVIAYPTL